MKFMQAFVHFYISEPRFNQVYILGACTISYKMSTMDNEPDFSLPVPVGIWSGDGIIFRGDMGIPTGIAKKIHGEGDGDAPENPSPRPACYMAI